MGLLSYLISWLRDYTATKPDDALLEAAERGDIAGVVNALKSGADVGAETPDGWTALHFASAMGRADIARLLLDAGANVSANTTSVRRTPLHWAARNGHTDAVHLLLRRGAQTASQDTDGSAPLHLAAAQGGVDVARLLLEVGADVSARRRGGFTPLHLSARVGNVHVTALLIERGADVLCVTQDGWTPLHGAAVEGELGTVRLLLERGADANMPSLAGRTPMDVARDDATRIVMRITHASAVGAATAHVVRSSQQGMHAPLADAADATAPAATGSAGSVPPDVTAWFSALGVPDSFAVSLGIESLRDIPLLQEDDLREVGMKPVQRRRVLQAAQALASGDGAEPAAASG